MTLTNTNLIAKIAAVVASVGLVASSFAVLAPAAGAQTTTTTTTTTTSTKCVFTRDLTIGVTGPDVVCLQTYLTGTGHFTFAGGATGYFGPITRDAVARWQAANAVAPAVGYFGPISRAKYNMLVTVTPPQPPTPPGEDDDDDDELSGGEADLSGFDISREESSGAETESEVEVFTVEFDVEDGDVRVERLEIVASSTNSSLEDRPWEYFDRVSVWAGDEEIADMDVDDRDAWDEEDGDGADIHRLVLTDLDYVVEEGDMAELTIAFDIGSIDDSDLAQDFDFYIPDDGIRAVDGEGIQHYIPTSDSDEVTFGFDAEETGDLEISLSSEDPDATTLIADADDESKDYRVFVFEMENNESADVLLTDLTIDVATSSGDAIDDIIDSATLVVDGDDFDGDINNDGTIDFDDIDFEIGGDETVEFELMISLAADAPDSTVRFSIDDADVTAEGLESGDDSDVSGSATGETHTIALTGIVVADGETSTSVNDDGDVGTFSITFTVDALEDDIYIYRGAEDASFAASTTGVLYQIYQGGSAMSATTTDSAILQSEADISGNYYVVREGDAPQEFTLTVTLNPDAASGTELYYVELDQIRFDTETTSGTVDDTVYTIPNDAEFETSARAIDGV